MRLLNPSPPVCRAEHQDSKPGPFSQLRPDTEMDEQRDLGPPRLPRLHHPGNISVQRSWDQPVVSLNKVFWRIHHQ